MAREIVVLSGVRTAIGGYGGSLKDVPPGELGAICMREAVRRAGVKPADVGHVVFGNVIHTEAHDHYLARVAGVKGGLPHETPALTVNRLCGSGLQAIVSAANMIAAGDADVAVAGGAENMSRSPYLAPAQRWGARMGDAKMVDMMVGALSDPFDDVHMGITAENVARRHAVSREDQDALAALAPTHGITVVSAAVKGERDVEAAIASLVAQRVDVIFTNSSITYNTRDVVIALARRASVPVVGHRSEFVDAGALFSYGAPLPTQIRRSAHFVDKVLRGASPADMPVEQSTQIELVVNLRTARDLKIAMPASVLARADRVVD